MEKQVNNQIKIYFKISTEFDLPNSYQGDYFKGSNHAKIICSHFRAFGRLFDSSKSSEAPRCRKEVSQTEILAISLSQIQ
jgi:hypothetical protein